MQARQRGLIYPYELIRMLAPAPDQLQSPLPPGEFIEHDLDAQGRLMPVGRPPGQNRANVVVGLIRHQTATCPEGTTRVLLIGDPRAGEVNIIVCGVNVGAQPYWNAEATMLMHTRGILIMTPAGSMVLTGKRALDYSGGVSADDNEGIGGYERVMGPNGQAQYFAEDISSACRLLLRHYEHTYVVPGERFPRCAASSDPRDRDVCVSPHGRTNGYEFETVGDVFSTEKNPGRKKPIDIRKVMRACIDADHQPLERWFNMRAAETAVVWDAHLGGHAVCLLVFAREVSERARKDSRVTELLEEISRADGAAKARLRRRYDELFQQVHSEKLGQVAEQFDAIHNIQRAQKVGAVHRIIPPAGLRPYLIDAVERGMRRSLQLCEGRGEREAGRARQSEACEREAVS